MTSWAFRQPGNPTTVHLYYDVGIITDLVITIPPAILPGWMFILVVKRNGALLYHSGHAISPLGIMPALACSPNGVGILTSERSSWPEFQEVSYPATSSPLTTVTSY